MLEVGGDKSGVAGVEGYGGKGVVVSGEWSVASGDERLRLSRDGIGTGTAGGG